MGSSSSEDEDDDEEAEKKIEDYRKRLLGGLTSGENGDIFRKRDL